MSLPRPSFILLLVTLLALVPCAVAQGAAIYFTKISTPLLALRRSHRLHTLHSEHQQVTIGKQAELDRLKRLLPIAKAIEACVAYRTSRVIAAYRAERNAWQCIFAPISEVQRRSLFLQCRVFSNRRIEFSTARRSCPDSTLPCYRSIVSPLARAFELSLSACRTLAVLIYRNQCPSFFEARAVLNRVRTIPCDEALAAGLSSAEIQRRIVELQTEITFPSSTPVVLSAP